MSIKNDLTDAIAGKTPETLSGFAIQFIHVPTHASSSFKAMLTSFEDNFKQDWASYETVGRMDPIRTYKRTSRIINFSIEIPSFDVQEAARNFDEIQKLVQMCYPTFNVATAFSNAPGASSPGNSQVSSDVASSKQESMLTQQSSVGNRIVSNMVSPPFFKIKFANWINNSEIDTDLTSNDVKVSGLYGTIENVKFSPDFTNGFYGAKDLSFPVSMNNKEMALIPSLLKLDIVFNVLHTNDLGYDASTGTPRSPNFPYGANKLRQKTSIKVT